MTAKHPWWVYTRTEVVIITALLIVVYAISGTPQGWHWLLVPIWLFAGKAAYAGCRYLRLRFIGGHE